MFSKTIVVIASAVLLLAFSSDVKAEQVSLKSKPAPEQLTLPENVRTVLVSEMVTISKLMGILLENLVQGNIENSASIAIDIRNSNLKKSFDATEIKKILGLLPKGFIKLDQKFHGDANKLAEAVKLKDFQKAFNLYSEMTQGCLNCHSTYSNKRFSNLRPE